MTAAGELFRLDPAAVRSPYPVLSALRDDTPVVWFDELEAFVVSRYDDIVEVLRQPEVFSSHNTTGPIQDRDLARLMRELADDPVVGDLVRRRSALGRGRVLVRADPPAHTRQRSLVNRAFSPKVIRGLEGDIQRLADELIDAFLDRGQVELVSELALPLPMTVIANALGVSHEFHDDFKRWSDGVVGGFGRSRLDRDAMVEVIRAGTELGEYVIDVIAERERAGEPGPDLVSQLVYARVDGEQLSRYEIIEMVIQFLIAGNETTAKLITATMHHLALRPEVADMVRAEPELVPSLLEEVLRLEPPSGGLYRNVVADYELGGVTIPAGSSVYLAYAAGNRDPAAFESPDECVLDREVGTPHLGFGLGPHYCLGAGLARAEARIAVESLLARCDDVRLAIDPAEVPYDQSFMVRGIQVLPLTFRPRESA